MWYVIYKMRNCFCFPDYHTSFGERVDKKPKTKNKTCFWWIFKTKVKKNWTKKNRNLHQFYMPYLKISMEVGLKKRIWIFDINIFKYNQSNAVNFATHAVVTCSFLYKRGKQKSIYANERRKKFRKLGLFHTWKNIFAFLPCHCSFFLRSREQNQQKFNLTRKK